MRSARKVSSVMTTRLSGVERGAQTATTAAAAMRAAAHCSHLAAAPMRRRCAIGRTTRYGPSVVPAESEDPVWGICQGTGSFVAAWCPTSERDAILRRAATARN